MALMEPLEKLEGMESRRGPEVVGFDQEFVVGALAAELVLTSDFALPLAEACSQRWARRVNRSTVGSAKARAAPEQGWSG